MLFFKDYQKWILLFAMLAWAGIAAASIIVIGNPNIKVDELTVKQISSLYLGQNSSMDGQAIQLLDQPVNSAAYQQFYQNIVGWSTQQVNSYWAAKIFTGTSSKPDTVNSCAKAIKVVANTPGLIAYVTTKDLASSSTTDKVKVLYGHSVAQRAPVVPHKHKRNGLLSGASYGLKGTLVNSHKGGHVVAKKKTQEPIYQQVLPAAPDTIWQAMVANFQLGGASGRVEVKKQIDWYLNHPASLKLILNNAIPYIGYVYQQVQKYHMPAELALLPFVESGYNPFAYSVVGAAGLWQMMPQTASLYGLNINWWYDSRRDVLTSTKAAFDFLKDMHGEFNNWLLALSAYNTGSGNLHQAIHRNKILGKDTDFWSLPLSTETQLYVPKILALADIIAYAKRYNIQLPAIPVQPFFTVVRLNSQLSLDEISKLAGISTNLIRYLNPGMRRYATPKQPGFKLLLPVGRVAAFQQALDQLRGKTHGSWQYHEVWKGENLLKIARDYHTTVKLLRAVNQMNSGDVRQGEGILVPVNLNSKYTAAILNSVASGGTFAASAKPTMGIQNLTAKDILSGKIASMNVSENIGQLRDRDIIKQALPPTDQQQENNKGGHFFSRLIDYLSVIHL